MRRIRSVLVIAALALVVAAVTSGSVAHAAGTWIWPVDGPVLEPFDPPDSPYGTGHRGIDIAVGPDTTVLAVADGVVTFAGPVGGWLFVTLDHGAGLESRYSFLGSTTVRRNDTVTAGAPIATSGTGHAGAVVPHLHFAVLLHDVYQDPLEHLGLGSVTSFIRLAPLLV